MYGFLADLMVTAHVAYVAFVVVGQILIWVGLARGWRWVRNFWFRIAHLAAIGAVVLEEFMEWRCPLTVWEEQLRDLAGQPFSGETFLSRLMHFLIFYRAEPWVFTTIYVVCGALVLGTFLLYPPRRPRLRCRE
jgi:hypothetical protein